MIKILKVVKIPHLMIKVMVQTEIKTHQTILDQMVMMVTKVIKTKKI